MTVVGAVADVEDPELADETGAPAEAAGGEGDPDGGGPEGGTLPMWAEVTWNGSAKEPLAMRPSETLNAWLSDMQQVSPRSRAT